MENEVNDKWIKDTAFIFYQIFSVDYRSKGFLKKLLQGGGGNSPLCSTWSQLSDKFVKYRISKKAYYRLISMIDENDSNLVKLNDNVVIIQSKIIKKYHHLFSSNAKLANNRKSRGTFFHFDHNPSNKKVLFLLKKAIRKNNDSSNALNELANYIKTIQTVDLITVEQDDIRTLADSKSKSKLGSLERDKLISDEFYELKIVHI